MNDRIANALSIASREIQRSAQSFQICDLGRNGFPERMVSYHLIHAIARTLDNPVTLLEVPIRNAANTKDDNHIDAIIFDEQTAIICEFKRAWAPSHWSNLATDARRVRAKVNDLRRRFPSAPKTFLGFYASDCWVGAIANSWVSGENQYKKWILPEEFRLITRGKCEVSDFCGKPPEDGHYLTWALEELPVFPTATQAQELLRYLPAFEREGFSGSQGHYDPGAMPYHTYAPELTEFEQVLYRDGFILRHFDWESWLGEAGPYLQNAELIRTSSIDVIRRLLTLYVRRERVCEGQLSDAIQSGHIGAIVRRINDLAV